MRVPKTLGCCCGLVLRFVNFLQLRSPPEGFEDAVRAHFYLKKELLIEANILTCYIRYIQFMHKHEEKEMCISWYTASHVLLFYFIKELETQAKKYKSKEANELVAEVRTKNFFFLKKKFFCFHLFSFSRIIQKIMSPRSKLSCTNWNVQNA